MSKKHILPGLSYTAFPFRMIILFFGIVSTLLCACSEDDETIPAPVEEESLENSLHPAGESKAIAFEVNEMVPAATEARRLQHKFEISSSDFIPTGLYLPPGTSMLVKVKEIARGSGTPELLIGTYSRYEARPTPVQVDISPGTHTISDDIGGLLWIRYNAMGPNPTGKVEIEFEAGHLPVPFFKLGETTNEEWQHMLDEYTYAPDVQMQSKWGYIVTSLKHARQYRDEDPEKLLQTLDAIFDAEAEIAGLDGSSSIHERRKHRLLLTESETVTYMAATHYRTMYTPGTMGTVLQVDNLAHDGWGPWHEIGHENQQVWTWSALGEVTVNIYALAAERAMGVTPSRLAREGHWDDVEDYLALPDGERDFNVSSTGLFVRLGMFQQLWLAYGDDFYITLHRETREERPGLSTDVTKMRYFMLKACTISGKDLTDFFKKWALPVPDSVYDEIAVLSLPGPETDLTTLNDIP